MYSKRPYDNNPYQGGGGYPGGGVETKRYKPHEMVSAGIYGEFNSTRNLDNPDPNFSEVCKILRH